MFDTNFIKKIVSLSVCSSAILILSVNNAAAGDNEVEFKLTDNPGRWFDTGKAVAGNRSIAIAKPGVRVKFSGDSNTVHTRTSLIFPTGAAGMPHNDTKHSDGGDDVTLTTPGLYVFFCSIHPYMFGAVIVDDPKTTGLDLGSSISLINGITVPSSSDLATRLLRTFFIATNPANWQDYASDRSKRHECAEQRRNVRNGRHVVPHMVLEELAPTVNQEHSGIILSNGCPEKRPSRRGQSETCETGGQPEVRPD